MCWEGPLVNMKKRKKEEKIIKYYKESLEYICESMNYIYFITFIFIAFGVLGFIFPIFFVDAIKNMIGQLMEQTRGLDTLSLVGFILLNNLKTSFLGLALGILFGIIPVVLAIVNGYVLGFVSNSAVFEGGFSSLFKLLPHGIFEIPAIIIGLGLGTKLGIFFFSKNSDKEFMRRVWLSLKVFLLIIIPLLVIAAFIEGSLIGLLE